MSNFLSGYKKYDTSNGYGNANKWRANFDFRMSGEEAAEIIRETRETPYTILGISTSATQSEIRAAWLRLITIWHPDQNKAPEATEMSKKINAAYTILKK